MLHGRKTSAMTGNFDNIVIVLPNGQRHHFCTEKLNTFSDLKLEIELKFGIPCELQKLYFTDSDHPVSDWVPIASPQLEESSEVFIKTEENWLTFVNSCLRQGNDRVLELLDNAKTFENRHFVACLIAAASGNENLILRLVERIEDASVLKKRTSSGRSLLHIAVAGADWNCIQLILLHCPDLISAEDCQGVTPIVIADKKGLHKVIHRLKAASFKCSMEKESNENPGENETRKEVRRNRESKSLKLNFTEQTSIADANKRCMSTPSSPSVENLRSDRLLERESFEKSLNNSKINHSPSINQADGVTNKSGLPQLGDISAKNRRKPSTSQMFLDAKHLNTQTSPRSLSPNSNTFFSFPGSKRNKSLTVSAPTSPRPGGSPTVPMATPGNSQSENRNSGLRQVVSLPPWRRTGGKLHANDQGESARRVSYANVDKLTYMTSSSERRHSTYNIRSNTSRSMSVAGGLSLADLQALQQHGRTAKPWNEWRRMSVIAKEPNAPKILEDECRKKSFEEWFIGKEAEREANRTKMTDEEKKKLIENERLEQERRMRCKSFEEWALEKEIEFQMLKDEEKRKLYEKQIEEDKLKQKKEEAKKKYDQWMMEKFQEELRKEEELDKLMKEKWKMKEENQFRRKSIAHQNINNKKPLTKSKSVPIV